MNKILLLISLFVVLIANGQRKNVNTASKASGQSLTAAEFNAVVNAINNAHMPTVADMLGSTPPTDSAIVVCDNYTATDKVPTKWVYLANSTATTNGFTILGSTFIGRFVMVMTNNEATFKQMGVSDVPADVSTLFQSAINFAAKNFTLVVDALSNFRVKSISLPSGTHLKGQDRATSFISFIDYTGDNQSMMGWNSGSISTDVTVEGINFEGKVKYAMDTVVTGTTAHDPKSTCFTLFNTARWNFRNCSFKRGFNKGAIYCTNSSFVNVEYCNFDSIGGIPFFTYYDSSCHDINFNYDTINHYSSRFIQYSNDTTKKQNGDSWIQPGGYNITIRGNVVINGNGVGWAGAEGRMTGFINYSNNKFYSRGRLSGGCSFVFGQKTTDIIISGNQDMDTNRYVYTRRDSFPRTGTPLYRMIDYGNIYELAGFGSLNMFNNKLNGINFHIGFNAKNAHIYNNTFDNSAMTSTLSPGSGNFITMGRGNGVSVDRTTNTIFESNTTLMGPGTRYLVVEGTSYVSGLSIFDYATFVDTINANAVIASIDVIQHDPITIGGVWQGYFGYRAISTVPGQVIDVSKADFTGTNISDEITGNYNFIYSGGATPQVVRENAKFSNGVFHLGKPAKQLLTVVIGNSIPGYSQNPGASAGGDILISNQLSDAMYFKATTSNSRLNTFGIYSYGGQKLSTILADLPTNFYPAIKTAGIVPDMVLMHALAENSIIQGDSLNVIQAQINGLITDTKNRWPGVIIHLVCPRLAVNYDTPAKVAIWRKLTAWYLTLDNGLDIFVSKSQLYEDPSNPGWPLSGYTDGIHPGHSAAILLAREQAKTLKRIARVWKTNYATSSTNMSLIGSSAVNSTTNVTGTRPTSVTFAGTSDSHVVALAENPGMLLTYTVDASTPNNTTPCSFDFGSVSGLSLNRASAFVKVQIVSGASNIKTFSGLAVYTDGTGNNFVNFYGLNDNANQNEGLWQDGDILTIRDVGTNARSGTITDAAIYFYVKPKLAGGTFSFRILSQGIGEVN